eukprot:TRINITY_DN16656_c0_g1_i2.p1 TRINITY_DN16656_c0_g1~~TRINITY_DN16656_c0_g1_i2.p1  ORF type:complete len:249 (-),score=23.73 TRINITY_DN16656_c0_g1_i2:59-805(-)
MGKNNSKNQKMNSSFDADKAGNLGALELQITNSERGENSLDLRYDSVNPTTFSCSRFLQFYGPSFLVAMAYLDPGNIFGDIQAGYKGGYKLLWVLLSATTCGLLYQTVAARIGCVTGDDIATLARKLFEKRTAMGLWVMAEIAIIGADIQEVIGTAIALEILFGMPIWLGVLVTILDTFLFLMTQRYGQQKLEVVFALLIGIMGICFAYNFFSTNPDYGAIVSGLFIPSVPADAIDPMLGLILSLIHI